MTKNEGVVDRAIRLIAGLAVIGAALVPFTADHALAWGWIEVVPLGAGRFGWSAVYWLLAVSMLATWAAWKLEVPGPTAICGGRHGRGSFHRMMKP